MSATPVILYSYEGTAFGAKARYILDLKSIPHKICDVPMILPRPEISELLGIGYRRIPILAIGNDVYCDTALISDALERRFPSAQGYGTIFPTRKGSSDNAKGSDIGVQKAFSIFYADKALFGVTGATIPFSYIPDEIIKDRLDLLGYKIDREMMTARQPANLSTLSAHLVLAEEQLSDGRDYFFDTVTPGLADVSMYFNFSWITQNEGVSKVLDANVVSRFMRWFDRVSQYLQEKRNSLQVDKIDGQTAAKLISLSTPSETELERTGFNELHASWLKINKGDNVAVVPEDTGVNHPTRGKLLALSAEEVVLEVQGQDGKVRVHFPRLGFSVTKV